MSQPTLDSFLSPSSDPLNSEAPNKARFLGVQGFHSKQFKVLDEQTISVDIILYSATKSEQGQCLGNNGIAIAIHDGDLIADNLLAQADGSKGASTEQIALFEELRDFEDYPAFSEYVNNLGTSAGRLRTPL